MQTEIEAPPGRSVEGHAVVPGHWRYASGADRAGGATDRNGNAPSWLQASTYRLLAEGLCEEGIASVRIDKRGMYGSASAIPDANDVVIDDYAADVHSWVAAIRARTGVSSVWVLGHSEGGLVALLAARQSADIAGLILVATAGVRSRPY